MLCRHILRVEVISAGGVAMNGTIFCRAMSMSHNYTSIAAIAHRNNTLRLTWAWPMIKDAAEFSEPVDIKFLTVGGSVWEL